MSDNQSSNTDGSGDEVNAAQVFVNVDALYSEPEVPTEEEGTKEEQVSDEVGTEEESSTDDKPSTIKYEFDDESEQYSFKSNGETVTANIEKLIENYSKGEGFTKKTTDLANKDKARAKEHSEALASLKKAEDDLLTLSESLSGLLEPEQIDWNDLRDNDTPEYLRQKELIQQRKDKIDSAKQQVVAKRNEANQAFAKEEFSKLCDVMNWDSQDKVTKGFEEISKYCTDIGMTGDDLKDLYSHKLYQALFDAAQFRALKESTEETVKEVKKAPKSVQSKKSSKSEDEPKYAEDILYGT